MASCNFQAQLVSILEVLAKAAVAEINNRVDDSCAVIRLEMTQSQRDIDVLKRKWQMMESELEKTRRRKGSCVIIHGKFMLESGDPDVEFNWIQRRA